ncbi:hypothetical protein [Variovorax sp. W6]|uniref:hypothetical protein n=1 Tax=Variovorax sp. W6 TaxID=3093895 RepID=UPI003D805EA2
MALAFIVPLISIAFGIFLIVSGEELCHYGCWLDVAADWLLPAALDGASGGLPFLVIGIALLAHLLWKMWKRR